MMLKKNITRIREMRETMGYGKVLAELNELYMRRTFSSGCLLNDVYIRSILGGSALQQGY